MSSFDIALSSTKVCRDEIKARKECYERQGEGVNTEKCFEEELNEKRCLSFSCCPLEAKKFYGVPKGYDKKGECSLWAEHFAFVGSSDAMSAMVHSQARETIDMNKEKSIRCRKLLMDLSVCMSQYSDTLMKIENRK